MTISGGRWAAAAAAAVVAAAGAATAAGPSAAGPPPGRAVIRYTEYGVPHILAADHAGLGYGQGYAQARDNLCVLALTHVQAAGESARHLGPGEDGANVAADAWFHEVNSSGVVDRLLAQAAPRGPGPEVRALVEGYAGGYNRYLADVGGAAGVTDLACRGAAWVRPVSALDIWRALLAAMPATLDQMMAGSATAQPPGAARAVPVGPAVLRGLRARTGGDGGPARGSNALAVGRAGAADGVRSVHVANPHFPWHGASRFYRAHLTIPGVVDAAGAAILGAPLLVHGHNHDVAWAHTVSTAQTHGLFRLTLAADDPTSYLVDGAPEKMVRRDVRVEVRQPGGGITTVTLRRWSTRYGPVVTSFDGRAYPWTRRHAYAVRDANSDNVRALDTWRLIAAARSTDDVRDALARTLGAPWLNTVASDRRGRVLYANIQAAPHVTDARVRRCAPDAAAVAEFRRTGRPTLDGSRSSCAWGSDPGAVLPGLFGPARQPVLERADWVGNANDSPWLTNPDAPLVGYPRVFGDVGTRRSPRTQELVVSVRGRLAGTDGQPGRGFTAASARDMLMAQHSRAAHLMRADLAAMCASFPDGRAPSAGGPVDVRAGCAALAAWDGRFTLDSRGALLFNLFWQRCTGECAGVRWRVPFDPADPVGTPYGLNGGDARVQRAFGDAAAALLAAGFPTDAPLRAGQRVTRGGAVVPIPGGLHGHGVLNVITPEPWVDGEGYTEIAHGSSYLHAVQFPAAGPPEGYVLLTYAQASDPTSPHHADQTLAFSAGRWERERFTEADVLASPALTVLRL